MSVPPTCEAAQVKADEEHAFPVPKPIERVRLLPTCLLLQCLAASSHLIVSRACEVARCLEQASPPPLGHQHAVVVLLLT